MMRSISEQNAIDSALNNDSQYLDEDKIQKRAILLLCCFSKKKKPVENIRNPNDVSNDVPNNVPNNVK